MAFFGVLSFYLASMDIHDNRIHYYFLIFFWVLASGPHTLAVIPPSPKFHPDWNH